MEEDEARERLKHAVYRLPMSCRTVAQYHYVAGASPEEIARLRELSDGEVQRQLAEAERLLPELMLSKPPAVPVFVPATGFRYLLDRNARVGGRLDPQPCVVCEEERPGFDLVVYHEDGWDRHYVCDPCLRAGRLAERGYWMNQPDVESLAAQLEHRATDLTLPELEALAEERILTVGFATPRPLIRQPFWWPTHCGDFYGFIRRIVKSDILDLAPDGKGLQFFSDHVQREEWTNEGWVEQVWEAGFAPEGFVNAYLWRCLHCGEHLITWDHD